MKKVLSIGLIAILSLTFAFGLTGCGEEITLASKTVEGATFDIPSDFGEFTETDGVKLASNEDSTASIVICPVQNAGGATADAFSQEVYKTSHMDTYTDVEFVKFDNKATLDGIPALFAHTKGKNSSGIPLEMYNYIVFFEDGNFQSIVLSYAVDAGSSLEQNIDAILASIKIA